MISSIKLSSYCVRKLLFYSYFYIYKFNTRLSTVEKVRHKIVVVKSTIVFFPEQIHLYIKKAPP